MVGMLGRRRDFLEGRNYRFVLLAGAVVAGELVGCRRGLGLSTAVTLELLQHDREYSPLLSLLVEDLGAPHS